MICYSHTNLSFIGEFVQSANAVFLLHSNHALGGPSAQPNSSF